MEAYSEFDIADTLEALDSVGEDIARETVEAWSWDQRRDVRVWCDLEAKRRAGDTVPAMARPMCLEVRLAT